MQNLQITPAAMAHIRRQLDQTQAHFLRLGVKESGCNGFMYTLDFLEQPGSDDQQIDFGDGVKVCVNTADVSMVEGTEIDLITEGLNSAMIFKNPKATSYCGCGESFAFSGEDGADAEALDPAGLAQRVGE